MSDVLLVGIDGSECSERAACYAALEARRAGAKLCVVFVIEWSPFSFSTPEENEERHRRREQEIDLARTKVLDPLLARLATDGIEVEGLVKHGHIAEVLNRIGREKQAAGIIIGRLGQGMFKSMMFGSVTSQLVQSSPIPVTVVP